MRRHATTIFSALFTPLVTVLTLLAFHSLYRYGSAPTDENWFQDTPSTLMAVRPLPGGVQPGDPLVGLDAGPVHSAAEAESVLAQRTLTGPVTAKWFRPAANSAFGAPLDPAALKDGSFRTIPGAAHVYDVIEGGASDRAGMKVGDLIIRINNRTFRTSTEADAVMRLGRAGGTTEYVVIRGTEERTLLVTLAAFGVQIPVVTLFLSGLLWMGTGAFIGLARPWIRGARLLALSLLCVGFVLAVLFIQRDAGTDILSRVRGILMLGCALFGMAFTVHSIWHYPFEHRVLPRDRWILGAAYLIPVVSVAWLVLRRAEGAQYALFGGIGVLGLLATVSGFLLRRRPGFEERREVLRVLHRTGILSAVLVGAVLAYVLFFLRGRGPAVLAMAYIGLPLALVPLAHLYTIGHYRLLDLRLRLRRTLQYSMASASWVALVAGGLLVALHRLARLDVDLPYVRVTGGSIEYIGRDIPPDLQVIAQKTFVIASGIALSALAWFLLRRGRAWIAARFHRTAYDYRRAASEFAEVMATKLTMDDLARGIVTRLAGLMQLKRTGVLFFRDRKTCCCLQAFGLDGERWEEFCLRNGSALAADLQNRTSEAAVRSLSPPLPDELVGQEFEYVVPIHSKHALVGAILIGEKQSESVFVAEDLEFLGAVSKQASVAIENAFLYEELAEQERLKHELAIARRIQMESLPQSIPHVAGLDIAGQSLPAKEVGGDYFDYLNGDGRGLTVVIGDVSGKGTSAALYMAKIQGILRSLHAFGLEPAELFARTNRLLCRDLEKKSFVTALSASFDPALLRATVARAGHLPLYLYRGRSGSVDRVLSRGLGLGISPERLFEDELEARALAFEPGDVFLFVTDGVTEAQDGNGVEFGEERLSALLRRSAGSDAGQILGEIMDAVSRHAAGAEQHDDQTVVVVKAVRNGPSEG